jgi:hypothetical protein
MARTFVRMRVVSFTESFEDELLRFCPSIPADVGPRA